MARNRQSWPGENLGAHYAGLARRPKPEPPMSEEHLKRVRLAMGEREKLQAACLQLGVVTRLITESGQFGVVIATPEPLTKAGKA
jgi:hypothetical protein